MKAERERFAFANLLQKRLRRIVPLLVGMVIVLHAAAQTPSIDHFSWTASPNTTQVGAPVPISIEARDASHSVVTNFNGAAALFASTREEPPSVLITEVGIANPRLVELGNVSDLPVSVGGWKITLYDTNTWPAPRVVFTIPAGVVCPPRSVFQLRSGGTFPGSFPDFALGLALSWLVAPADRPTAVLLSDETGATVDFFCAGGAYPALISDPRSITQEIWQGLPVPIQNSSLTYQRNGVLDHNNAADWSRASSTAGTMNPGLRLPFRGPIRRLSLIPDSVIFTNGAWSGFVNIQQSASNVWLNVDDGSGRSGESGLFTVVEGPPLLLHLPTSPNESSAGFFGNGIVSITNALSSNLVISVAADLQNEFAVPSQVTLLAGQTNVSFALTNLDDAVIDGPRVSRISVSASGFASASGLITNQDNEAVVLTMSLPATMREGDGILTGGARLTLNFPTGVDLPVGLSSSNTNELQVPASVIVPKGQTSVLFNLTVIDDGDLDGPQPVTISANYGSAFGSANSLVTDNESTNLFLDVFSSVEEGRGTVSNAIILGVFGGGRALSNIVVTLASDNPAKLQVPPQVTIPAGQSSVPTTYFVADDVNTNGTVIVNISASASGFSAPNPRGVAIHDNDPVRFIFAALPNAQIAGTPFPVTISAQTLDGYTPSAYAGSAILRASGHAGPISITPSNVTFTAGTWSGNVTVHGESRATVLNADDGLGHIGTSNPFDISLINTSGPPVSDLVYDAARNQLLAGVTARGGTDSNSVVGIDPETAGIIWRLPLGAEPGRIALSDDYNFLYVGGNTTGGVMRIDLNARTVVLRFPLGSDASFGNYFVEDMEVMPGHPRTIVVSRKVTFGGYNQGLAVYDDHVRRSSVEGPGHVGFLGRSNEFYSASGGGITIIAVTPNGLLAVGSRGGALYATDFEFDGGRLYGTSGTVFSPKRLNVIGSFPASGWVRPDASSDRIAFLSGSRLSMFDQSTFEEVGSLNLALSAGNPNNLVRCGANRYAFKANNDQLVILRTDMVPLAAPTDASIAQTSAMAVPLVGSNLTYHLMVSNLGPVTATNLVVTDQLPAGAVFVSAVSSNGFCSHTNGTVNCQIGSLASAGSASLAITVLVKRPGELINTARVIGGALNPSNDVALQTNVATFGAVIPAVTELVLNAEELAYDAGSNRLWASVLQNNGQIQSNSLWSLRLATGLPEVPVVLATEPRKIAISGDGQYLYVGVHSGPSDVVRFNTRTRSTDLQFSPGTFFDMKVVPGDPTSVIVARGGVALYRNGIQSSQTGGGARRLEYSDSPTRFYGVAGAGDRVTVFERFDATATTVQYLDADGGLLIFLPKIKFASGRIFSSDSVVLDPIALARVGTLPASGVIESDPVAGQVFYLGQNPRTAGWFLTAFDAATLATVWAVPIAGIQGSVSSLIRCGSGLLAFNTTEGQLFIVNTALIPHSPTADLQVWFDPATSSGPANSPFTFTGIVLNNGPAPAINVVATNILSPGTVILSHNVPAGSYTNTGAAFICQLGDLAVGQHASFTLTAMKTNAGVLLVSATGASNVPDPNPTNNTNSFAAQIDVPPAADLSVWDSFSVGPGGQFNYTIFVSNSGPDTAANVLLNDFYPAGGAILGFSSSQGSVATNTGFMSASLGSLSNASVATVSFQIQPALSAIVVNRAEISSSTADPLSDNNNAISMATPSGVSLLQQVTIGATDFAYDPTHRRLYASVSPTGGPLSNSVVAIDPDSGSLVQQIPFTEPVGKLAVSDGGGYLYAALVRTGAVLRINTTSAVVEARITLPDDPTYGTRVAFDVAPIPGRPQSIAVSSRWVALGYNPGIEIYDGTNIRPNKILISAGAHYFFLGTPTPPDRIFANGYGGFHVLPMDNQGVTFTGPNLTTIPGTDFVLDNGIAYFDGGDVLNPDTQNVLGRFPVGVGFIAPDIASNRVYFLPQSGGGTMTLQAFDPSAFAETWSIAFPVRPGTERGFLKMRSGEFAIRTDGNRILLLRTTPLETPAADLVVTATDSPDPVTVGGPVSYTVMVRNDGPWKATNIVIRNPLPANAAFVSASANQGSCILSNDVVVCSIDPLARGASATATITMTPTVTGILSNQFIVTHGLPELNPANNSLGVLTTVGSTPTISIANAAVLEGSSRAAVSFNVTLSGPSTLPVSVGYSTSDGSALAGADYDTTSGTVLFAPGTTSRTITLSPGIRGDSVVGSNRFFYLVLTNATNAVIGRAQATATIIEDDFYNILVQNTTAAEGNVGSTNATFTVRLAPAAPNPITVSYETLNGTATAGSDYLPKSGAIRFAPGITTMPLLVPVFGDTQHEIDETLILLLVGSGSTLLVSNEVNARIINDDAEPTLALLAPEQVGNLWRIRFSSAAGKSYRVLRSETLNPGLWSTVSDQVPGTGGFVEVSDPGAPASQAFYRVQVLP